MSAQTVPQGMPSENIVSVLGTARQATTPAMRAAVARLTPGMARVAGYQLGWLAADGREETSDSGKAVRPALALLSAAAAGAPAEAGLPGAVAVELVHNFSLLHDDVMDRDEERRHRATAWTVFGDSAAILGGVALLTLAEEVLLDLHTDAGAEAARLITRATARLVTGQTHDIEFESRALVPVEECVVMAGDKTAALISCSAAIGAVLARSAPATIAALAGYGEHLGLAYQLVDDILGIWGAPERTGKPVLADLRAGKKSLPVVAALRTGGPDAVRLGEILRTHDADEPEYVEAAHLIEKLGGRDWVNAEIERQLTAAGAGLDEAAIHPAVRDQLHELADYVVNREL
ncbi:MAG: polyprenyl synthetase family protein [Mycobacteriales bacterium]